LLVLNSYFKELNTFVIISRAPECENSAERPPNRQRLAMDKIIIRCT